MPIETHDLPVKMRDSEEILVNLFHELYPYHCVPGFCGYKPPPLMMTNPSHCAKFSRSSESESTSRNRTLDHLGSPLDL